AKAEGQGKPRHVGAPGRRNTGKNQPRPAHRRGRSGKAHARNLWQRRSNRTLAAAGRTRTLAKERKTGGTGRAVREIVRRSRRRSVRRGHADFERSDRIGGLTEEGSAGAGCLQENQRGEKVGGRGTTRNDPHSSKDGSAGTIGVHGKRGRC